MALTPRPTPLCKVGAGPTHLDTSQTSCTADRVCCAIKGTQQKSSKIMGGGGGREHKGGGGDTGGADMGDARGAWAT